MYELTEGLFIYLSIALEIVSVVWHSQISYQSFEADGNWKKIIYVVS